MQGEAQHAHNGSSAAYLLRLESLASEIRTAIRAITENELEELRGSIASQQELCAEIAAIVPTLRGGIDPGRLALVRSDDPELDARITATTAAIRCLNHEYSLLLNSASRNVNLLTSLCRSHAGMLPTDQTTPHSTWSCEV